MVFVIAFGGLAFGSVLLLILAKYAPHPNANVQRTERVIGGAQPMPFDEFRALIIDLLDALKLEVVLITGRPEHLDILVRSSEPLTGGRFLVNAILEVPGDIVDQQLILSLHDHARADAAAKGILITPYTIVSEGLGNLELPIELIDGLALRGLVERYLPPQRATQLAKYRGFGL